MTINKDEKNILEKFDDSIHDNYFYNQKYINRELSWIEFNKRVLFQAMRKDIPMLERLNFLGISTSNLDEFIMVRFSTVINRLLKRGKPEKDISGLPAMQEYLSILKSIKEFRKLQDKCYEKIVDRMEKSGISFYKYKELSKQEKRYITNLFTRNIYPLLTPLNYDTTNEFPELNSKQLNIVVSLEDSDNGDNQVISFIPLDNNIPRVYEIPSVKSKKKYITLEEIVYNFLDRIYYHKKIIDYGTIKLLREADVELNHDRDVYITDRMRNTLLSRKYSSPIFMDATDNLSKSMIKLLSRIFDLDKKHIFVTDSIIDYRVLQDVTTDKPENKYKRFTPQYPSELIGEHDMFSAIDNGDILLHHPYESYDPVVKFLEHAANNKDTVSIKQTLYRVSSIDSPIINALCTAAQNGKQVSVILELKARFDEERNISLIEKLKLSGCNLIYGDEELKTHCKFITVVKRTDIGLKIYSHMGTGNYNDKTARLYTDISYFTSNFKVGSDLITVFNMLSGFSEPTTKINKIYFSPYNLRKKLVDCIDNEIKNAKNGKTAIVTLKMNSLCDKKMIDKLYEASEKGVKVMIFCRGICSMKPINDNIKIRSIVGRFLEHSRIYYFHNGKNPDIYISSADLLTRNLDKRFELLIPIKHAETKHKLTQILSMYYKDTFNSFEMTKKGKYVKLTSDKETNIHDLFMNEAIENYKLKSIPKMMSKK